jgi:hypothetical protein
LWIRFLAAYPIRTPTTSEPRLVTINVNVLAIRASVRLLCSLIAACPGGSRPGDVSGVTDTATLLGGPSGTSAIMFSRHGGTLAIAIGFANLGLFHGVVEGGYLWAWQRWRGAPG